MVANLFPGNGPVELARLDGVSEESVETSN
jgi:hypothetical protein